MSEPNVLETSTSLETVIRSLTDAELAAREVTGAVERFRSASAQLSESRDDQAAARTALGEATAGLERVAAQVKAVAVSLDATTAVLRAIEPERLWQHLESMEARQAQSQATMNSRLDNLMLVSTVGLVVGLVIAVLLFALYTGIVTLPS